jgi:hypothetical protein
MIRQLAISAQVGPGTEWNQLAEELARSDALQRHAIRLKPFNQRWPLLCAAEGSVERLADIDVEAMSHLITELSSRTNSVFTVSIAPGTTGDGSLCWVKPRDETDGQVLRAMLWEAFCEA